MAVVNVVVPGDCVMWRTHEERPCYGGSRAVPSILDARQRDTRAPWSPLTLRNVAHPMTIKGTVKEFVFAILRAIFISM